MTGRSKGGDVHVREIVKMHEMIKRDFDLSEIIERRMKDEEDRAKTKK